MDAATGYAIGLLALLAIKHVIADFLLQSRYILENRRIYGHPAGILHVGIHAFCSVLAISVLGLPAISSLAVVLAAEALLHYHIDWTKDRLVARLSLSPNDRLFWHVMGIDQGLHQLTYVAMAAYLASEAAL